MKRKTLFRLLTPLVAIMLLSFATVAYAITIVIDGTQEAAWTTTSNGQLPGTVSDDGGNEAGIADTKDIEQIRYTNDDNYFYILLETYDTTGWNAFINVRADFCFDTGEVGGASYPQCANMTGIDRIVRITGNSGALNYQVFDGSFAVIYSSVAGDIANSGSITELRIPIAQMGFSGSACDTGNLFNVYLDGGDVDPDDNTPDNNTASISCGAPTAVSLQSFGVDSAQAPALLFAGLMMLLLASGATVYMLNQHHIIAEVDNDQGGNA